MFTAPRVLTVHVSVLALWGVLAAVPQTAWGDGVVPAIRGTARLDAMVANSNSQVERHCLNDGSGGFPSGTNCASFSTTDISVSIVLGDVDGDGDLDAVVANAGAVEQRCLNDGSGSFTACNSFNGTDNSFGIALGDVDGDGDLDVVVANFFSQVEQRCLNDGSGGFTNCASFNTNDSSRSVVLGDVDGDGDLDAVVANNGNEQRCLNDGSGGFTACNSFNGTDNSLAVALGDVDGDGDLDAVVANNGSEQRCLNDGSGGFTACASFNTADSSLGIALGDVDGDGDPDAVVANDGQVEQCCLNNGSGGFTACASFNATDDSSAVALGDLDGDGDLDALVANFGLAERRCLNDGSGSFTACASFNTTDSSRSIALGDLNGDGPDGNLSNVTSRFVGGATTSNFQLTLAAMITGVKPLGLVALYEFDAEYCNINHAGQTVGKLRTRTIRVSKGNVLSFNGLTAAQYLTAPEWREGGIGAELVVPEAGTDYADGLLAPNECATLHYRFNLFSLNNYRFVVRLYGTVTGPDALPDSRSNANDLSAVAATEIELDLGSLQAAPETTTPPTTTTPGGSAPTPVTPVLSFPAGTSNLPSRR